MLSKFFKESGNEYDTTFSFLFCVVDNAFPMTSVRNKSWIRRNFLIHNSEHQRPVFRYPTNDRGSSFFSSPITKNFQLFGKTIYPKPINTVINSFTPTRTSREIRIRGMINRVLILDCNLFGHFSKWDAKRLSVLGGDFRSGYRQLIQVSPMIIRPMDFLTCSYVFGEVHLKYSYSLLCSDFQHFPYKRDDNCYSVVKSCIHKCLCNIQKILRPSLCSKITS